MGKIIGAGLKGFTSLLYLLAFCAAGIIIGIWSYFLAKLSYHDLVRSIICDKKKSLANIVQLINKQTKAIEGMAGGAVIYTFFAMLMTCCLGGRSFFAILGLLGDLLIMGCFIAIAVLDRAGAGRRTGNVATPIGNGLSNTTGVAGTNLGLAARLNTVVFSCAVAGAGLMLFTLLLNLLQWINHRKEKSFGPSPDNDYTSGRGKKGGFFARRSKKNNVEPFAEKDVESVGVIPATGLTHVDRHAVRNDMRPSYDTEATVANTGDNAPTKYETPVPQVPAPIIHTSGLPVTTTHYTTPAIYDPEYNPTGSRGTNLNF